MITSLLFTDCPN